MLIIDASIVSTHSRLKAADAATREEVSAAMDVSTHSRLKAAEKASVKSSVPILFQHTAA